MKNKTFLWNRWIRVPIFEKSYGFDVETFIIDYTLHEHNKTRDIKLWTHKSIFPIDVAIKTLDDCGNIYGSYDRIMSKAKYAILESKSKIKLTKSLCKIKLQNPKVKVVLTTFVLIKEKDKLIELLGEDNYKKLNIIEFENESSATY